MPEGLSWYERAVLKTLRDLHEYSRNYIQTRIVAGFLDKNDRIIRGVLYRLEQKQVVERKGLRGGWKPVDARSLARAAAVSSMRSFGEAPLNLFSSPRLEPWKPPVPKQLPNLFSSPKLEPWKPPVPKQPPAPVMLQEYLDTAALQAVI